MKTITFTCETITPMFLSGADGQTPELRAPSIKGALRFWWRAMKASEFNSIIELKKAENEIFGGIESKATRSKVLIRLNNKPDILENQDIISFPNPQKVYDVKSGSYNINVLDFLAYGVKEKNKKRGFFQSLKSFSFNITLPNDLENEINQAFYLFSYFGGLGSKSRNGFGSFLAKNVLAKVDIKEKKNDLKDFTSFSKETKLFVGKEHTNYYDALAEIGKAYHDAKNFIPPLDKGYISLPLRNSKITSVDRHSKTFFLSLHQNENKLYQGKILFLPYNYLSDYEDNNGKQMYKKDIEIHQDNYKKVMKKFCQRLIAQNNPFRLTEI